MRFSFASGVRVFDSAKAYGSDGDFKKWFDKEGEVRKGRVSSICDFGAFVDIGGADGLVHLSDHSWSRVRHPS